MQGSGSGLINSPSLYVRMGVVVTALTSQREGPGWKPSRDLSVWSFPRAGVDFIQALRFPPMGFMG